LQTWKEIIRDNPAEIENQKEEVVELLTEAVVVDEDEEAGNDLFHRDS
jgi:hypothetical protein